MKCETIVACMPRPAAFRAPSCIVLVRYCFSHALSARRGTACIGHPWLQRPTAERQPPLLLFDGYSRSRMRHTSTGGFFMFYWGVRHFFFDISTGIKVIFRRPTQHVAQVRRAVMPPGHSLPLPVVRWPRASRVASCRGGRNLSHRAPAMGPCEKRAQYVDANDDKCEGCAPCNLRRH